MDSRNLPTQCKSLRRATAIGCLLTAVLLGISAHVQAAPTWTAASSFGGSGWETGQSVKVDRDGNRYVTGGFSTTASFPGQAGAPVSGTSHPLPKSLTSAGGTDVFLAKYDKSGNLIWLTQAGGSEDDQGFDLAFDSAGNVYVTGVFVDNATFHGVSGAAKTLTGVGETIFLAKYSPAGVLTWVQTGTTGFDSSNNGYGVAIEPSTGSVYVTGVSQGGTTFSSSNGSTHTVAGPFTWHMYLVKFDTTGAFRWGVSNEAEVNTVAHKVAVDGQSNVYVTGWMEGQTTFSSIDGNSLTVAGFSGPVQGNGDFPDDAYLVKYDSHGNVKWANHIGGYKAIGTDVAASANGNVSITGFVGNVNGSPSQAATIVTSQPGGANINLGGGVFTSPYNPDVFIATYNGAGVLLDARRFGGAQVEGGSGIVYDSAGSLIVSGVFANTITIDSATVTEPDPTNLFVAKFPCAGSGRCAAADWVKHAAGPGTDGLENDPRLGLTPQGDVLVVGAYQPTAQFAGFRLLSTGGQDGFLALLTR